MFYIYNKKNNTKKGISLVISLIMMALLLSISFSISNIILRQLRLTNTNTSSQIAFYGADAALECTLYWDTFTDGTVSGASTTAIFGIHTPTTYAPGTNPVICGQNTSNPLSFLKQVDALTSSATTTFSIDYGRGVCARVQVIKTPYRTKIYTSGYNTGVLNDQCATGAAIAERVVERGLIFSH